MTYLIMMEEDINLTAIEIGLLVILLSPVNQWLRTGRHVSAVVSETGIMIVILNI